MHRTVVIVDDHARFRRSARKLLELEGFDVVGEAADAASAVSEVEELRPDIVLVDIGLPDADGRDVCQALRSNGQLAPVMFLTALGAVHDKLSGFSAGADDYLPKPFDPLELVARVEVLARRAPAASPNGPPELVLDPARHSMAYGGREVLLTPTEFRMLAAITSRPGQVVRRRVPYGAPRRRVVADRRSIARPRRPSEHLKHGPGTPRRLHHSGNDHRDEKQRRGRQGRRHELIKSHCLLSFSSPSAAAVFTGRLRLRADTSIVSGRVRACRCCRWRSFCR